MGCQSIKISNVVLHVVLLCISESPTRYQFKNKLRTIQPKNSGKIENSQSEPQFDWFLYKGNSVDVATVWEVL